MKRIWKFEVLPETRILLPIGARIVRVESNSINPEGPSATVWAEGRFTEVEEREVIFHIIVTGGLIMDHLRHVGSFRDGKYIGHVYVHAGDWLVTP